MKKVIRLTESDLHRIVENSVRRVLNEAIDELSPEFALHAAKQASRKRKGDQANKFAQYGVNGMKQRNGNHWSDTYEPDFDGYGNLRFNSAEGGEYPSGELGQEYCRRMGKTFDDLNHASNKYNYYQNGQMRYDYNREQNDIANARKQAQEHERLYRQAYNQERNKPQYRGYSDDEFESASGWNDPSYYSGRDFTDLARRKGLIGRQ